MKTETTTVTRQTYPKYNWVDVKVALPTSGLRVLIKCGDYVCVGMLTKENSWLVDLHDKIQFCSPSHWLPLPI